MVDSITKVTATRVVAPTPVAAVTPATGTAAPAGGAVDIAQAGGLARTLAASPPVDSDRVATIKKAIADGRFPILPATIADRLIALKLQWKPDDAAHDEA